MIRRFRQSQLSFFSALTVPRIDSLFRGIFCSFRGRKKSIIVLRTFASRHGDAISYFHGLDRTNRHQRFREAGIQFVKDRFSDSCRNSRNTTLHNATCGISFFPKLQNPLVRLLLSSSRSGKRNSREFCHACRDFHAKFFQNLLCDSACRHPGNRFPSGGTSTAPIVPKPVLTEKPVIRVSRSKAMGNLSIILRALVFVSNQKSNRCSRSFPLKNARKNLHEVSFFPLCHLEILSGTSPLKKRLNILF